MSRNPSPTYYRSSQDLIRPAASEIIRPASDNNSEENKVARKNDLLQRCQNIEKTCRLALQYLEMKGNLPKEINILIWIDRLQLLTISSSYSLYHYLKIDNEIKSIMTPNELIEMEQTGIRIDEMMESLNIILQNLSKYVITMNKTLSEMHQDIVHHLTSPDEDNKNENLKNKIDLLMKDFVK